MTLRCVFPAPAGVILYVRENGRIRLRFPRTCGGDPMIRDSNLGSIQFSPHLRG